MRKTITASEGYVLTDGTVYGTTIHLADDVDASEFYEITEEEYAAVMSKNISPELLLGGATAPGEATAEDYQAALSEFGVKI